jgi:hypothetical protein
MRSAPAFWALMADSILSTHISSLKFMLNEVLLYAIKISVSEVSSLLSFNTHPSLPPQGKERINPFPLGGK